MATQVTISRAELAKIPFLDSDNIGGRTLTTLTFFEGGKWHMWLPSPTGLVPIIGRPVEADYFGRNPENDTDMCFDFLNFMTQRACWADSMRLIDGIRNDIHNLGASLGKLDLFHRSSGGNRSKVTRFASTEVEYLFGVCRSLFDLLQRVIATLWNRIPLVDKSIKKKQLPSSFRDLVLNDRQMRTPEEIVSRWRVPVELAYFYQRHGGFFRILRQYRDEIVHSGKDFACIFVTEKGFAVSADVEPFASFGVWNAGHMLPNGLASLRPVVAHVITETFRACDDFAQTIQKIIEFPPEIAPGFRLFVRGYHNQELLAMKDVLANCLWWEAE